MEATVMMVIDGVDYPYGTYPINTNEELNKANNICQIVGIERDCNTWLKIIGNKKG